MNIFKCFYPKNSFKYYYVAMLFLMPILFILASYLYFHAPYDFHLNAYNIGLAVIIYLFSHLCRVVRLAFLTLDDNVKFRQLFRLHFHTAALSRMLPFKLGELNRIYMLGSLFDRQRNAIMVVWIERLFDSLVIALFLLFLAFTYPASTQSYLTLIGLLTFFVILSFLTFFVLPETLNSIKQVLIMRYNKSWILGVLNFVSNAEQFVNLASPILKKKIITLTILSMVVWISEIGALAVLISGNISLNKLTLATSHLPDRLTNEFYQHSSWFSSHLGLNDINWNSLLTLASLFFVGLLCLYFDYKAYSNHRRQNGGAQCHG